MCNFVKLNRKFLKQGLKVQEDDGAVWGGWAIVSCACVRSGAAAGQLCPAWGQLRRGSENREWTVIVSGRCYLIWSRNPLTRLTCGPDT